MKRSIHTCIILLVTFFATGNLPAQTSHAGLAKFPTCEQGNSSLYWKTGNTNTIGIRIFPNPVRTTLKLCLSHPEPVEINIYNTMGQLVNRLKPGSADVIEVDCSRLAGGMYILQVVNHRVDTGSAMFLKE